MNDESNALLTFIKRKEFCYLNHKCISPDVAEFKDDEN